MAFEQGAQTGTTRSLGVSSGEFRAVQRDTQTFPALTVTTEPPTTPIPNLHYVFDDPNDGEPGRDRMLVHGLWELVLALAVVGAGFLLTSARPGALSGTSMSELLLLASVIGLLAVGSALGLRAGVPNLAVGACAVFAGHYIVQNADGSWGASAGVALAICAGVGLVQGLVVVGLHVPAWAASFGVIFAGAAWVVHTDFVESVDLGYNPRPDDYLWFGGVVAISVVASVVGIASGIRRGFGRFRPVADPAKRRGRVAAVIAVAATVVSSVLAGIAGVLSVLVEETAGIPLPVESMVTFTAIGLGAALLGGTSAFGRRGGVFGTVLAASLLTLAIEWVDAAHRSWSYYPVIAMAILVGLAVTRLVERFGKPVLLPANDDDGSWSPRVHTSTPTPWRSPTPAGGLWSSDEGWGTPR